MTAREYTLECSHCNNRTLQQIQATLKESEVLEFWDGDETTVQHYYYVVQCRTCQGVSLYTDWELSENPGNLNEASRLYPKNRNLQGVPKAISDSYNEAKKIEKRSPTAFAILIRRTLEYLCKDKDAKGSDLKEKLEDLAKRDIIPSTLARMANALRYLGNVGAHSDDIKIGFQEAKAMDDFFIAIIDYVYIAPNNLKELAESLKKKG